MKIGFDAKRIFHNTSGLGNYSRDIVRALQEYYAGNSYLLYNPKPGKVNRLKLNGNMKEVLPRAPLYKRLSSLWRLGPVVKQLKDDQVDIFHGLSNELPAGIEKAGIPSVVTIHDLIFLRYPGWYSPPDRVIHTFKVKQAARLASRIIAISHQTKEDLIHFLKVPAGKIQVIYQGCHPAFKRVYTQESRDAIRSRYELPDRFLLCVGTIEPRKNLLTAVRSLLYHPLPLVVVGRETDYVKKVREYITQQGLQKRVHFLSNVSMEDLAIIYQSATVFCYLSIFEGFGIPVIEALYSRIPVVTSKGGCFSEAGGPGSFYIDSRDEKALAGRINTLLQDPDLYQRTMEMGWDYVQRFDDRHIAGEVMNLYESLLKETKARPVN